MILVVWLQAGKIMGQNKWKGNFNVNLGKIRGHSGKFRGQTHPRVKLGVWLYAGKIMGQNEWKSSFRADSGKFRGHAGKFRG